MRNFVKLLACVLALAGLGMSGCNKTTSTTSTATKTDVNVQFVPSIDAGRLATLTNNLKPILEKYEPNYNFNLTSGDSYAAVTEAMLSDQMDIGFLTASGYAEATLKHPGKVEVLLTSVRKGYKVQCDDYPGTDATALEKQKNAMNDENGYTYLGQQSEHRCQLVYVRALRQA
jgi:ABC-type phosphate/phosphonate transport system substrate-binding protein